MTATRLLADAMRPSGLLCPVFCVLLACSSRRVDDVRQQGAAVAYDLGKPAPAQLVAAWDIDVSPNGGGLPPGRGTPPQGAAVFAAKCAVCHGAQGQGQAIYPQLIGAEHENDFPFGSDPRIPRTIGNYWPYATTVFDYVRRAMPFTAPHSLTNDEVYAVTAYLLAQNKVIPSTAAMDATTLPKVRMPARDRFVPDDRRGGPEIR